MGKIELGNIVLILLGIVLFVSGPYIAFRTVMGVRERGKPQIFSDGINILIAVLFLLAGALFVWNNLKGNPLA